MYPCYFDWQADQTDEITAFWQDCESVGVVYENETWLLSAEWAAKFQQHLQKLMPIAESGNALAQYNVAVIYMLGYCYSNLDELTQNYEQDMLEMSKWLERSARQGLVAAVDNLLTSGVGTEAERLREIWRAIQKDVEQGNIFAPGETWRRAYGAPVSERNDLKETLLK